MDTPALEGINNEVTAEKIGGAKALGPDCETGRKQWWRNAIFAGMVSPCHF